MKNYWTQALLLGAMLGAGGAVRAQAPGIGIIDEDKLAQNYKRYKEALVRLDREAQEMDAKLQARGLLDAESAKRFDTLILKEGRSAAESTELDTLSKKGDALWAEQIGLGGKVDRSEADNKRLEALNGAAQINGGALQSLSDKLFESYKARQTKIDDENTDRANKVIQQVADDRKLALVWRKRAIIWNAPALDITDEVLSRLNK